MNNQEPKHAARLTLTAVAVLSLLGIAQAALGSNIDPLDRWAWSTNAGWINFRPACNACEGVTVYADHLEGYAWGENIGWIRMGTHIGGGLHTYGNTTATDYGVNRDLAGKLSGYAWSTNVGWINFDASDGGVTVGPGTGILDGYAWSENVGWIHFGNADPAYHVLVNLARVYLPVVVRSGW